MKIVHERMGKVNDTLGKNKVVGMTFYYVKAEVTQSMNQHALFRGW